MNTEDTGTLFEGDLLLPAGFPGGLAETSWKFWCPDSSPLRERHETRNAYAPWLSDLRCDDKGVYIWLTPRCGRDMYRFVHVGISGEGESTMASRTKTHCSNLFAKGKGCSERCTKDFVLGNLDKWEEDDFGYFDPAEILWNPGRKENQNPTGKEQRRICAATKQLENTRIVYIRGADDSPDASLVRELEGVVAHTAARFLETTGDYGSQPSQITNTLSACAARYSQSMSQDELLLVTETLNKITAMLPKRPRIPW